MSVLIIGGTGFIGRRLVPLLAQRGEEIVCMDINPQTANFSDLGRQVRVIRGDVNRVAYASSLAVSGEQKFYGDRLVTEDDFRHGHVQYAMHKIFNEWQAQDYREKHGMGITAIRPANVTGPDKIVGSVDHVFCITNPARGKPVKFPYRDAMRCPIHVDEIAEIFAREIMTDKPQHWVYNSGGQAISLGDLADIVRGYLP